MRRSACVAVIVALSSGCAVSNPGTGKISFPPHPRAAYSVEEIEAWKADPNRQKDVASRIRRGEQELKTPIEVPDKGGQWIFYYRCPKDNGGLQKISETEHKCRSCGKIYSDERTNAAYRTVLHGRVNARCYNLALAYALSGDDKFAIPVRDVLLRYADLYPTYQRHDRWGRVGMLAVVGGRRYCQHLTEGIGMMKSAEGYDLIYNSKALSDAQRKRIEEGFLLATAREILKYNIWNPGKNNHQTWFNAAYAVAGLVCGDEKLLNEAVNGKKGFHAQLKTSVTADGLWFEGTVAYHFYALQAMERIVEAAARVGWDLTEGTRLKEMFTGPMRLAYPNGQFPAINDGDYATLRSYRGHYRWAHEKFGDDVFKPLAEGKADTSGLRSAALEGAGLVALRKGSGKEAACVMLDYGEHGAHHGHPDKLNLMVYALGREIVPDPGRLTYSVPEHLSWSRQTVAHSTVVIDGKSQEAKEGELLFFEDHDEFAVCMATGGQSYPGVEQRRFLLLTEKMLVDALAVVGTREMQLDWILHGIGKLSLSVPSEDHKEPLGKENGYQHLTDLRKAKGAFTYHADWQQGGQSFRATCFDDDSVHLFTGNGIGYNLRQKVPFLLRRRRAKAACFLTVYDLTGKGDLIEGMEPVSVAFGKSAARDWQALGLLLRAKAGSYLLGANFHTGSSDEVPAVDGRPVKTFLFEKQE